MDARKYLGCCLGIGLAAFSLDSTAAQPEYVPGEVLIVPDTGFRSASVQTLGMSVKSMHTGSTRFSRVKVKPGQTVEAAVQALANTPGIKYAEPNYIYHATAVPNDPAFSNFWGLRNTGQTVNSTAGTSGVDIGAVTAWDTITDCSSIIVAVIDSGVDYNHPDLASVIWNNGGEIAGNATDDDGNGFVDDTRGWDFVQGDNDPMDFHYHGTHVAGTIGALGNNNIGGVGVCWNATIMPLRALGSTGSGSTSNIVAAVDYAVANGAKVINMSLGGTGNSSLFNTAIANANAAGALVVAAAGNDGQDNDAIPHYPASYDQPNIIAVAATDQNDALASFSDYGVTSVDVAAPGVNIYSTRTPDRTTVSGCSWNFDGGTKQGWTSSTYDTYNATTVTDTVDVTATNSHSGSYSLTDTPAGNYDNYRIYTATSPGCDLTGEQGAVLAFAVDMNTELSADYVDLLASGDGSTWISLLGGGVSGSTNGVWYTVNLDLQNWDGVATTQVRWTLTSDYSIVYDGVYIDDVAVTVPGTLHTGSDYAFLSGTSMATPYVAGAAALIWANEPTLSVSELRSRLIDNGDPVSALSGKTVSGRRINVMMALPVATPTALAATAASATQVDLSWTDNSVSEASYQVQRSAGGAYTTIATLAADAQAYSDTSTAGATTYTYRVLASARDGRTSASATASATTPAAPSSGGGGGAMDAFLLIAFLPLLYHIAPRLRDRG